MIEILRVALIILLLTLGFACYFLILGAFFPRRVSKTMNVVQQMPGRAFGIGLVNFLFFGTITILLFAVAENFQKSGNNFPYTILIIPALFLTGLLLGVLFIGLLAMITLLGEQLFPDLSQWRRTFWGTVILAFACAVPVLGWFLLFPAVALTGFGAFILGLFQRNP
jgi:hypothetical protein